jgi:uncharacterized protein YhhL (DUF1145 family)
MLPTRKELEEELEEELERKRLDARERNKHSDSTSRVIAPAILLGVMVWGAMCFNVLYAFSEWRKMANISVIIGVLVGIALIAIKVNQKSGSPISPYTIFNTLLAAIFAVLYFLVEV